MTASAGSTPGVPRSARHRSSTTRTGTIFRPASAPPGISPATRSASRAGYGLYYDAFSQDFFVGQLPWNTFNPGPAYNDILFSFGPVSNLVSGAPVFEDSSFSASDVFTVDPELRTPHADLQRQLPARDRGARGVQVGYVGSLGRSLFRYRDINQLIRQPAPRPSGLPHQPVRVDGAVALQLAADEPADP